MIRKIDPELQRLAESLNIEIETPYGKPDLVAKVRFSFPPDTWADLCNRNGELLHMCCANISSIRECFSSAIHNDGWMDVSDLQKAYICREGHEWEGDHPVAVLARVYEVLEGHLYFTIHPWSDDVDDPGDATHRIAFSDIWKWAFFHTNESLYDTFGVDCRSRATHNFRLFEIGPTIGVLARKIKDMALPPAEGWAILRKGEFPKLVIYQLANGSLAIFPTLKEADEVGERWYKTKQVSLYETVILPVRVSFEKGVELLDRDPTDLTVTPTAKSWEVDACWKGLNEMRGKVNNDAIDVILRDAIHRIQALGRGNMTIEIGDPGEGTWDEVD